MKVEELLNVTFDESPPPTKLSPLVNDDVGEEEAIRNNTKVVNNNNEEDESIEVDEVVNIKESKNHLLDQVIGNLNQRTLRSQAQAQDHSNFFCFISTIEPKNVIEKTPTISPLKIILAQRLKVSLIPVTVRVGFKGFGEKVLGEIYSDLKLGVGYKFVELTILALESYTCPCNFSPCGVYKV
nr:hypothetical protein CTI12_AA182560 [Tanacetum cinerariifolium]